METKHAKQLKQFGLIVKKLREENDLAQVELAGRCEIDIRTVQRIEAGEQNLTFNIILNLAEVFEQTPSQLLKGIK